jgi:hypothetical protein
MSTGDCFWSLLVDGWKLLTFDGKSYWGCCS